MRQTAAADLAALLNSGDLAGGLVPTEIVDDDAQVVAVILPAADFRAICDTQALLATNGALAAISEGLADLAASRSDSWTQLRTDYGRGDPADPAPGPGSDRVTVSHRARWDLELLAPETAKYCFDLLDQLNDGRDISGAGLGFQLTTAFTGLRLIVADGYRIVARWQAASSPVEIVHLDGAAG